VNKSTKPNWTAIGAVGVAGVIVAGLLWAAQESDSKRRRTPTPTRASPTPRVSRTPFLTIAPSVTATLTPTATSTRTPIPTATATSTETPTVTPTPTETQVCLAYPLGVFGLPLAQFGDYSGAFLTLPRDLIIDYLDYARADGMRLVLSVDGRNKFQDADLHFSLSLWKTAFDNKYAGLDLSSYIADGTLVGIALLDEPQDACGNWGCQAVAYSDIDAAAEHAKDVVPGVTTWVGSNATWLSLYDWVFLDGVFYPYTSKKGNVYAAVYGEVNAAMTANLRLMLAI